MMLKRSLLCLILFFCFKNSLTVDCPAPVEFSNDGYNNYSNVEGRLDGYSNALNGSLIERIRSSKTDTFYQNIVDNSVMFLCDVEIARVRCVDKDSPLAAKNANGDCIFAVDSPCDVSLSLCERTSNCYWDSVIEDENRTTRFPPEDYSRAEEVLFGATSESYVGEIARNALVGVILSIVLLIGWFIFFVIRYMCCCLWESCGTTWCCLCSPIPKQNYKTCSDKIVPVLIYILSLAAIVAAGAVAWLGNEEVSVGLSNAFIHADGLVNDLQAFLGRTRIPLININAIVDYAAADAELIFDGTEYVTEDASQIAKSFLGFYSLHSEELDNSDTLIAGFESVVNQFDEKVTPITTNVQSMLDTLELDLYDQADTIEQGIGSAVGQIDSFTNMSVDWQNELYNYEDEEYTFRPIRRVVTMSIFLLSLISGIMGLLAIMMSKRRICCLNILKIAGFLSALLGSLAIILASVLLSMTFLLFDSCKVLDIVTQDFEPYIGDRIAPGLNAAFNDTNLAVAFNVTDKVDFQQQLEDGLSQIENVNITSSFQLVLDPLSDIQTLVSSISTSALEVLNQATSINSMQCPFNDTYTKDTILEPWTLTRVFDETPYVIRDNEGNATSYERRGPEEDGEAYLRRIYNKAGVCSGPTSCCIKLTPAPPNTCSSNTLDDCDFGSNCNFVCQSLTTAIIEGRAAFIALYGKEQRMTSDLGVLCPTDASCPTEAFKANYSNFTLVAQIENYKTKISATKDSLVSLASTSVGDAMLEVEDFLCNMNVSFVERRYDEIKNDICNKTFMGVEKVMWGLYALGLSLEALAVVTHVLSVRLNRRHKHLYDSAIGSDNGLTRVDVW